MMNGIIDLQCIYNVNILLNLIFFYYLIIEYFVFNYIKLSWNNYQWYGLILILNLVIMENIYVFFGVDVCYYCGYYFQMVDNLIGVDYVIFFKFSVFN